MIVTREDGSELRLPDFLVVGAAKSATTSLYHYLNQHPDVRMSSIKESWYFSFAGNPPRYASPGVLSNVVSRAEDYSALFDGARPGQKLGDASPSYLYTWRDTIRNIRAVYPATALPQLRIIISLREPVSRAYSQYWTFRRVAQEPLPFEQAVDEQVIARRLRENWNIFYDYTGFGRYYDQVKAYLDEFGRDRVLVVLYEDIQQDPRAACRKIFDFIGVDPGFTPDVGTQHNNVSGESRMKWLLRIITSQHPLKQKVAGVIRRVLETLPREATQRVLERLVLLVFRPRRVPLSREVHAALAATFAEDSRRLEALIGRDLGHWRGES
jgi:hypothetical protein